MNKSKKPVGEWAMFKRRLFAACGCMVLALGGMVWALVSNQALIFIPSFLLIMAAWVLIMVAEDTGSFSTNPRVRGFCRGDYDGL